MASQKIRELKKIVFDLINEDTRLEMIKNQIEQLGWNFSSFDFNIEINDKLELELFNNTKLKETKRLLNRYELDSIDFIMKNFDLQITQMEQEQENKKRNRHTFKKKNVEFEEENKEFKKNDVRYKIQNEVNELLQTLKKELERINYKLEQMIQENFFNLKEDNEKKDWKQTFAELKKNFKIGRVKAFTKFTILTNIKLRQTNELLKYETIKLDTSRKIAQKGGILNVELAEFFVARKKWKKKEKDIKITLKDINNFIDNIIEEQYIELVKENYKISHKSKNYVGKNGEVKNFDAEIDKRKLTQLTFNDLVKFFTQNDLDANEFKG